MGIGFVLLFFFFLHMSLMKKCNHLNLSDKTFKLPINLIRYIPRANKKIYPVKNFINSRKKINS